MRFILAAVSLLVSLALFGVGIFQIVAARAEDHVTAAGAATNSAPLIVIPSETLVTHAGAQQIDISGDGPVIAVVGRQGDVAAWVGSTAHDLAQIDPETGQMVFTPGEGTEPTAPNPAGSDLWYAEYTGEGSLEVDASLPPGFAVLIASTGDAAAPGELSITWPLDGRAPWSGPLLIAGAVFLLLALGLGLWGLIELRRGIKPRRKSNATDDAPIPLAPGANGDRGEAVGPETAAVGVVPADEEVSSWPPPTLEPSFSGVGQDGTTLPSPWASEEPGGAEPSDGAGQADDVHRPHGADGQPADAPSWQSTDAERPPETPAQTGSTGDGGTEWSDARATGITPAGDVPATETTAYETASWNAPETPSWNAPGTETRAFDASASSTAPRQADPATGPEPWGSGNAAGPVGSTWGSDDTAAPGEHTWAPSDDDASSAPSWQSATSSVQGEAHEHVGSHRGTEPWDAPHGAHDLGQPASGDAGHHAAHGGAEPWATADPQGVGDAADDAADRGHDDDAHGPSDAGGSGTDTSEQDDPGSSDSDSDSDSGSGSGDGGAATGASPDESTKWRRPRGRDRAAAPKRLFRIAPVFLVGTLFLTGCSSVTMWPEALGGPAENPTATPTSSIDAALAEEGAPLPALSDTQLAEILADTAAVAEGADAASDATQLEARFTGAALTERAAMYKARSADGALPTPEAFPTGNVVYTVPEATDAWPRTVFTVVESGTDGEAPFGVMLVQEGPRDAYKVGSLTRLAANVSLPDAPPMTIGSPGLATLGPNLAIAPDQLAAAYGSVILEGDASPSAASFSADTDPLREQIGQAYRDGKLAAIDQTNSRIEFANRPGSDAPLGVGTLDGGAIVAVSMEEVERFSARSQLANLSVTGRTAALAGVTQSPYGFESVFTDQLLFYVPPASAGTPVQFLGYSQTLTSARQLDVSEVTFG